MNAVVDHYVKRIEKAVELIEVSLRQNRTPSLAELAEAAHLSKYHFHRIYRLLAGETCQQTISRLKLASAAIGLQSGGRSVTELAHDAGYSSSQAFAKAIKRATQSSASKLQAEPERLADTIATLSRPAQEQPGPTALSVELVSLETMDVVVVRTSGSYADLNVTYEQLFMAAGGPENVRAILGMLGPHAASLSDTTLAFDCALQLRAASARYAEPVQLDATPAGMYLRCRHQGSYDNLDASVDGLYRLALSEQGCALADQPVLFHYLDDPEQVEEAFLRTDLYMPVLAQSPSTE